MRLFRSRFGAGGMNIGSKSTGGKFRRLVLRARAEHGDSENLDTQDSAYVPGKQKGRTVSDPTRYR